MQGQQALGAPAFYFILFISISNYSHGVDHHPDHYLASPKPNKRRRQRGSDDKDGYRVDVC
jgi:hypothetical protein